MCYLMKRSKKIEVILQTEDIGKLTVGDNLLVQNGAPGIGHILYKITQIDEKFVYGFILEDTTRILDPSEVI